MLKLLVVYAHLLGTCLALGMMAMTDLRLLGRVFGNWVVIPPPPPFELRVITGALVLLVATGAMLLFLGLQENPNYLLGNEKLQGKMLLVALLCLNAFVLHFAVFPLLSMLEPVANWTSRQCNAVALAVGLSNSLWLYSAFLGIARSWNQGVPIENVLLIGFALFLTMAFVVRGVLHIASRNEPDERNDWVSRLSRSFRLNPPRTSELPRGLEASRSFGRSAKAAGRD
jgi:hypothetical protein